MTTRNHDVASALNARIYTTKELHVAQGVDLLAQVIGAPRVDAEERAAQAICDVVEGLPLAVEIVAQRLHSRLNQSLQDMLTRLQDASQRLDALRISDRAVRTAFEVSWTH